jgi:isoleucyl-tRNA synthetase
VDGARVPLEDGDLVVTETPREGWTVASAGGLTVALDLTLTPELESAGRAREAIRLVQEARKAAGLEVSDRIELWWTADGAMAEALTAHADSIAAEVLAVVVHPHEAGQGAGTDGPEGSRFWLAPVSR